MNIEQDARPLTYPSVSSAEFQLNRTLATCQRQFQTSINNQAVTVVIAGLAKSDAPCFQLDIELNGQACQLFVGQQVMDFLLPAKIDHAVLAKLPEDLVPAVINKALQPVLDVFQSILGVSSAMIGFQPCENVETERLAMGINFNGVNSSIQVALNPLILQILDRIPAHQNPALPDISFWASLQKGHTRLTSDEFAGLEVGDIVFLETHGKAEQLIVRVNPRVSWLASCKSNQVTIRQRLQAMDEQFDPSDAEHLHEDALHEEHLHEDEEAHESAEDTLEEHDAETFPEGEDTPVDLSDLSVTLMFEVGEQSMTADEIQGLHNGYTFLLDNPVDQPVKLRANGKLIGECQLVEVEGRLGARISRLNSK
ncbi:YscQ/HrcQ family type III secretion apparatus protein [Endozoicomonas sp. OPT23]|uniref:type III secretion system cytoplasmic ring protein SctQ n=1 Tax=Endozoicomonas sp. OPT23 TaxID=2072845 RepID=UPI00129B0A2C|nr:type III secretion system cytoplasmic ring protein SctQ [Endozoicomonas sp. OPT23]MRI33782.1 YscQ/HrcQ family type III secretion apparatus protein [Endozoicomonas sp. OPT23]